VSKITRKNADWLIRTAAWVIETFGAFLQAWQAELPEYISIWECHGACRNEKCWMRVIFVKCCCSRHAFLQQQHPSTMAYLLLVVAIGSEGRGAGGGG
jgi:hypothetical protein